MKNTVRILMALLLAVLLCAALIACGHDDTEHVAAGDWLKNDTHHWKACEDECEGAEVDKAEHTFDNACDAACNVCGATRSITHTYASEWSKDATNHWHACTVCGAKDAEVAHTFDKTAAHADYLKAAATATAKAQYYKSCACGAASATEYFESDKAPANLSVSDISKTYDGTPVSEPAITFDGVGGEGFEYWQGTTKLTERPTNAGTYKVVVTVGETETHAGDRVEREFTIAKKVLSNLSVDLTYAGTNSFEVPLGAANGILAGDVADGIKVCITFANKNVGAAVTGAGLDAEDGENYTNYELDLTTCTANIVPKVLTNLAFSVVYNGSTYHAGVAIPNGVVAGDEFLVDIDLYNKNAGTYTCYAAGKETSVCWEDISYDGDDYENYEVDRATATITVTPKPLRLLDIEFTYDGGNIPSRFDLTAADGVIAGDDVWLYGDAWQSYDVTYAEYTLTDDLGDYDYDEGVELRGADKGNYKFSYDTDGSVGKITVMPYILDFTGEYVKDADGTHYFTFTQDITYSWGGTETVTVQIALIDSEGNWITAPGVYTQENAEIGDESFYIGGVECDGFELDERYYADEFKVTVLSTDDLILQATNRLNIGTDYIIVVQVKQGTVKVGDSIVLPGTPDKVYEVLKIEKLREFSEYATVGDEVGLYVDGMAELTEVSTPAFLYEAGNIPEMATEFLAELYLKTQAEGGRQTPVTGTYTPTFRGLGPAQQATITLISHYAKEDSLFWTPGETVLAKITLTTPVPAALLHGLEFKMTEDTAGSSRETVTGAVVDDIIESAPSGNAMLKTDAFDTEAQTPVVVKITNTRTEALDTLELFVSNGSGGGSYLTDYTIELYDEDFVRILGTHNNTEGTFTKDDSTTWSLAAGDTCYVVVKTTNATNGVFVRLM